MLDVSNAGIQAGYRQPSKSALQKAGSSTISATAYPAPLVLPDDLLTDSEENDPQSFQDFMDEKDRNPVTPHRKTIYLVPPPKIDKSVAHMNTWARPESSPKLEQIREYVAAFYHGMPVRIYKGPMKYIKSKSGIDLLFGDQLLDIRTRACPDRSFKQQLNLNDLIDVLINMLPKDAYAIMMITDHDIYEDDDDDYVCGRAYGGSRAGLVSIARYNPAINDGVDHTHAWPASHCQSYINQCLTESGIQIKKRKIEQTGAIREAIDTYRRKTSEPDKLWLARVCKTVTHELGHCLGMDHCCYYACLMQGTCNAMEDARQPPYFCPIDERKLLSATGSEAEHRNRAMIDMLQKPEWSSEPMFAAYEKWLSSK